MKNREPTLHLPSNPNPRDAIIYLWDNIPNSKDYFKNLGCIIKRDVAKGVNGERIIDYDAGKEINNYFKVTIVDGYMWINRATFIHFPNEILELLVKKAESIYKLKTFKLKNFKKTQE